MDPDAFDSARAARRMTLMDSIARQVGEPMKTSFDPLTLFEVLAPLGFKLLGNLDPAEIEARFFHGRGDAYHAFEGVHFAGAIAS
jgi:O-methyltransferase involved in polyketide biosynthesis